MTETANCPYINDDGHVAHRCPHCSLDVETELKSCPVCPDGYEWIGNDQSGRACPICEGYAVVNLDGSPLRKDQIREHD